jgi:uncharacterized protein (DUF302 family)
MKGLVKFTLMALGLWASLVRADGLFVVHEIEGDFEAVRAGIVDGITGQGLLVAHTSNVAKMLNRTGKDIGDPVEVYQNGEVIEFCSASLSRKTTKANPNNIMFCPFSIGVYQQTGSDKVTVSYMRLSQMAAPGDDKSKAALEEVEGVIAEIVEEVLE